MQKQFGTKRRSEESGRNSKQREREKKESFLARYSTIDTESFGLVVVVVSALMILVASRRHRAFVVHIVMHWLQFFAGRPAHQAPIALQEQEVASAP